MWPLGRRRMLQTSLLCWAVGGKWEKSLASVQEQLAPLRSGIFGPSPPPRLPGHTVISVSSNRRAEGDGVSIQAASVLSLHCFFKINIVSACHSTHCGAFTEPAACQSTMWMPTLLGRAMRALCSHGASGEGGFFCIMLLFSIFCCHALPQPHPTATVGCSDGLGRWG